MVDKPGLTMVKRQLSYNHGSIDFRCIDFLLFLVSFISFAYFYPGSGHNEAARFDSIRALLDEGHFYVDSFASNSADLIKVGQHYYSSKAPGTMILALPIYWVTDRIISQWTWISPDIEKHWVCYLCALFTVSLCSALTTVLIYRLGLRLKVSSRNSAIVALSLAFGTLLFPFSIVFFGHTILSFLILFASYQILAYRQEQEMAGADFSRSAPLNVSTSYSYKRLWWAGLAMGFAVVVEFPGAIAVGILFLFALWTLGRKSLRAIIHLMLASVVGSLPLFIHNYLAFNDPFFISYSAYTSAESTAFEAHKYGVLGIRLPFFEPGLWRQFLHNLAEITYRPLRGLFFLNPVLWLIIPGFAILVTQWSKNSFKKETVLALALCSAYFIFNASYGDSIVYWGGGASFGPRHLATMIPLLCIPLFGLVSKSKGLLLVAPISLASIFVCTVATAVQPLAPYGPNNIFFDWYLPRFFRGQFSTSTSGVFSRTLMTSDSVAFNWGKLIGLSGPYQLWPLLLFWLVAARILEIKLREEGLDKDVGGKSRGDQQGQHIFLATAILCAFLGLLPVLARILK